MNSNPFPFVTIIIVNWNGQADTLACLASLRRLSYPNYELLVVDNGSSDDSVSAIKAQFPAVTLIQAGENLGFVGGNNLGLERAVANRADYALLLNNDTEVEPHFLTHLVETAQADPAVAITGPTIYYFDHPNIVWSAGGAIDRRTGNTAMAGLNQPDEGQFGTTPRPVDFVTGCALLIKMPVAVQLGFLDPRFFMYYEETEWCARIGREGYKILHVPQAKIWHKISIEARADSPLVHYYMTRNRLLFLALAHLGWRAWFYTLFEDFRTLLSWTLKPKWGHKRQTRSAMLQALFDAARGKWGKQPIKVLQNSQ